MSGRAMARRALLLSAAMGLSLAACDAAGNLGGLNLGHLQSAGRVVGAASKAFEKFTPEQEHYLGRTVAANLLVRYPLWDSPPVTDYVNQVGQALAAVSDTPDTFNGYRFAILDTDEQNAFAAPGGIILVSRGLLRCARSEDGLAAILAHEIAHIHHRHGVEGIEKSRKTELAMVLGTEVARHSGKEELQRMAGVFEGSVKDFCKTLLEKGYSRDAERDADRTAAELLIRVGYDPQAFVGVLEAMEKGYRKGGPGFMSTHPGPSDRLEVVRSAIGSASPAPAAPAARKARFAKALGKI